LFFGAAAVVSAMIEYKVVVYVYNSKEGIVSLPWEIVKFIFHLIFGEKTETEQAIPNNPLFPLLTVIVLEGAKCKLIIDSHSSQKNRSFWRGLLRTFLIVISIFCSLVFFAQLMNKPNEDSVNAEIEEAVRGIHQTKDEKIKNDTELSNLRKERQKLTDMILENIGEEGKEVRIVRGGGDGHGPVAEGIVKVRDGINAQIDLIDNKIKNRRGELETEATNQIEEKTKTIKKGGRALDPKWMSAILSAIHEGIYTENEGENKGNYPRNWAFWFFASFSVMISLALELIINEMFKSAARQLSRSNYND